MTRVDLGGLDPSILARDYFGSLKHQRGCQQLLASINRCVSIMGLGEPALREAEAQRRLISGWITQDGQAMAAIRAELQSRGEEARLQANAQELRT